VGSFPTPRQHWLLAHFEAGEETLLCRIVTADETWIFHFKLGTKKAICGLAPPSTSPKVKIQKVSVSEEDHDYCLLGLLRRDSSEYNAERRDSRTQRLHQDTDRTQKAFQRN